MRMYDIIEKKKRRTELTAEEISFFVDGAVSGEIPDYQISAFLMAVYFNSMTDAETSYLTDAMANSGDVLDLSNINGVTADKHSTGGVGDKTTLIAAPIASALGIKVAKMSGRGLGHTGGTIDKLESIPGFKTDISPSEFINQVNDIGISIIAQSGNMVPADKKLYAIRDVTATVNSLPLIASSIMSKKIAAGSKNIVLDVKYGSGAFMKTAAEAEELANKMIAIGKSAGRNTAAVISSMDTPLGEAIGNSLEVIEAIEILKGGGATDLRKLSVELSALMCSLSLGKDMEECRKMCERAIEDGSALMKLRKMTERQGGDPRCIDDVSLFKTALNTAEFKALRSGYISFMNTELIGVAASCLGAGRNSREDKIDKTAGIILKKKTGGFVKAGETIAVLYSCGETDTAMEIMKKAVEFSDEKPEPKPLIYKIIR